MTSYPPLPPDVAIQVVNMGKRYQIGALDKKNQTFGEVLMDTVKRPARIARALKRGERALQTERDSFWALRDISFEVPRGEVVGVIGRNGAGKSTLLKILTRITNPDEGYARIRGRVGSLLEVGTGFHGELTGRENIYLNGAILGMHREEIDRRFDEIVAFSGVERFIDTPVKRYSSGMYLRLAFSVAAHLEPDILLVDEVLAVGDVEFQKKSMGKMNDVASQGRTVLFVSHNLVAVQRLCTRAILLHGGQIATDADVDTTIEDYVTSIKSTLDEQSLAARTDRKGGDVFRFIGVDFLDATDSQPLPLLISGKAVRIRLHYELYADEPLHNVMAELAIRTATGAFLLAFSSEAVGQTFTVQPGKGSVDCIVPRWPLNAGWYTYSVIARAKTQVVDWLREAGQVSVERGDFYGTGKVPAPGLQGVFVDYDWQQVPPQD